MNEIEISFFSEETGLILSENIIHKKFCVLEKSIVSAFFSKAESQLSIKLGNKVFDHSPCLAIANYYDLAIELKKISEKSSHYLELCGYEIAFIKHAVKQQFTISITEFDNAEDIFNLMELDTKIKSVLMSINQIISRSEINNFR